MEKEKEEINIGKLGENIACRYLEEKGLRIVERNYRRKYGEIDIIAESEKRGALTLFGVERLTKFWSSPCKTTHFVEVKAIKSDLTVTHETDNAYHPLDNMHPRKIERLKRAVESYHPKYVSYETKRGIRGGEDKVDFDWQFDVIAVWIDIENKKSKVQYMENVAL